MTTPPLGWRLQSYPVLDSTQTRCREQAEAGEPECLAILAERQSAGQGTQGRGWESPAGNLSLSVLLRPDAPAGVAAQWGLLAAVALVGTVLPLLPSGARLQLKWPNDLLLDGGKLAGILTQSAARADARIDWLVIGFGVNLAVAPAIADRPTACIGPTAPAPETFAAALLARLDCWRVILAADGFAAIRAAWMAFAPEAGTALTLRLAARSVQGAFAGLHEDGRLLLLTDGQTRAFAAGEI